MKGKKIFMIVRTFLICFYLNIFFVYIIFKYITFAWPERILDATEKLKFIFLFDFHFFWFSKFHFLYSFGLRVASIQDIFCKFSFSFFERYFRIISIFQDQKTILFDTEKLAFMFSVDFEIFENFRFWSFFMVFGVRVVCFLHFSFLLEQFWFKM